MVGYWAVGWAFAYGPAADDVWGLFLGYSEFFFASNDSYPRFLFQFVFAATAATIVSGAVAERCEMVGYFIYCAFITSIVYPIVTHWGWSSQGWMYKGIQSDGISVTYTDFAGSGMVHVCGGSVSLVAASIIGPRVERFDKNGKANDIPGHSVPFTALGGLILMFGFLAFNGGSMADIVQPGEGRIVALAMVNTLLSGSFAALVCLFVTFLSTRKWSILATINGTLA
ncbi:Protein AMT-4, partial [Aphelenchoides avenae]